MQPMKSCVLHNPMWILLLSELLDPAKFATYSILLGDMTPSLPFRRLVAEGSLITASDAVPDLALFLRVCCKAKPMSQHLTLLKAGVMRQRRKPVRQQLWKPQMKLQRDVVWTASEPSAALS